MSLLCLQQHENAKITRFQMLLNGLPEFTSLLLVSLLYKKQSFAVYQPNCAARTMRCALMFCVAERKK